MARLAPSPQPSLRRALESDMYTRRGFCTFTEIELWYLKPVHRGNPKLYHLPSVVKIDAHGVIRSPLRTTLKGTT